MANESRKYCSESPDVEAETGLVKMSNGQGILLNFKFWWVGKICHEFIVFFKYSTLL